MALMTNRVKVWRHFWGLTIETNSFAFGVKVMRGPESNLQKSRNARPDSQTDGRKKPGIEAVASLKIAHQGLKKQMNYPKIKSRSKARIEKK